MKHFFSASRLAVLAGGFWLLLLVFDLLWSFDTTFRGMSFPETYINSLLLSLVLTAPYLLTRRVWPQIVIMSVVAILLECNLMYCRVYLAPIPLDAYGMAGNLSDFKASVADCLSWRDMLLPVVIAVTGWWAYRCRQGSISRKVKLGYCAATLCFFVISVVAATLRGGFGRHMMWLRESCYYSTTTMPVYTVGGVLAFQSMNKATDELTAADRAEIESWLMDKRGVDNDCADDYTDAPDNLVIILCESLESWVIGENVDGKPITPFLNSLLADSTTLYFPHVLTQVDAGRSIDAQLLITAGMLPLRESVYSMLYPSSTYPSLPKAMKEVKGARSYLLTCDKPSVWNQAPVARAFGIDTLLTKDHWRNDEKVGNPAKLSDGAFMRQTVEKLEGEEIWPYGEKAMLTLVTYSGHNPFRLPEPLRDPGFALAPGLPPTLEDYITMAHYTDASLRTLVDYMRSRPDYDRTLIVITGDHEALGARREELRDGCAGRVEVSPEQFVPLIILNAPEGGTYEGIIGQIDIYPTLISLMGLRDYGWHGLGDNVLCDFTGMAISSMSRMEVGDTASVSADRLRLMRTARDISDKIIRKDYFRGRY